MTAAQIRTAARLVEDEPDDKVVSMMEVGSEGVVLWIGPPMGRGGIVSEDGQRILIARDGSFRFRTDGA